MPVGQTTHAPAPAIKTELSPEQEDKVRTAFEGIDTEDTGAFGASLHVAHPD